MWRARGLAAVLIGLAIGYLAAQTAAQKTFWTLGIYTGESSFALRPASNAHNPALTGADVTDMN
jgi:hypothetical protein